MRAWCWPLWLIAVPYLVLSVLWGVYLLSFAGCNFLGWPPADLLYDDASDEPDPLWDVSEKHGHD